MTPTHNEKQPLISEIMNLFGHIQQKMEAEDDDEKQWLLQNCHNSELKVHLKEITVIMLHVIEAIGKFEPVNGITISKEMGIFKGTVSKVTRKLLSKNLIKAGYLPNNKKEILFSLTPLGKELFELHERLHQEINKNVVRFFQKYDVNELQVLSRFIRDASVTSWVQLGTEQDD